MSVSLLLVPLALAGAAAVQARAERRSNGQTLVQVNTRMRDVTLLADALRDTGAVVSGGEAALTARWGDQALTFGRDADGIWSAHADGVGVERAVELITAVDAAYGRRVQQAVLDRIRAQAPAAGLRLESESRQDDASVRLVFEVETA
ncbi:hypothetical protein ACWT_2692 [Actinoplanes sp. SE50]|uniref:hypothetical protein n=1 Tax=unclassified Actinoplanes TaxID=2626549 RepID=UPI00023ECAFD|nr:MULTISPECIES: hypothetical protein [unclassified Actinoplanes]AEV83749.1 hypothetical protein ACPL_2854 [Actinoplanes sp. SE50/110]ATO82107.1 hypothetical protein ACWT_2692 [Actinoplanes sp. SE50]SLL99514.1 hypothetical protein ACSP50_2745 [Actinoplanes sp. SE50/110]